MTSIPALAHTIQTVLTTYANQAAQQTGFIKRTRHLDGAGFVQTLVFGWLANPAASLEQLTQSAANLGIKISPQGLEQRFTSTAAHCLQQVLAQALQHLIAAAPLGLPLLERFNGLYVLDSTTISLPAELKEVWQGCGGRVEGAGQGEAALKVQVLWNLSNGELQQLDLQHGRDSDNLASVQQVVLPAGSLRLADLGYFNVKQLAAMSARHNYLLSRFNTQTALYDLQATPLDLLELLQKEGNRAF